MNDYIYDMEAEQFSFLRVPKILLQHESYKHLSAEAKLLYSLLLDRVGVSMRNGWVDAQKRVYIIFTVEEIQDCLNCGNKKAVQLLNELENRTGLIERKRQGLGKPNLIYVKSFIRTVDEYGERHFLKCQNDTSRNVKRTLQEVSISHSNNTEINKTEKNETNLSFLPEGEAKRNERSSYYKRFFEDSLHYSDLIRVNPMDHETIDGILDLLIEICCCSAGTIRIAGDDKPSAFVKDRLLKLKADHIEYVLDGLKENTTKIRDMKQYLLTALFNAPVTISPHYQSKVNYDLYGFHE